MKDKQFHLIYAIYNQTLDMYWIGTSDRFTDAGQTFIEPHWNKDITEARIEKHSGVIDIYLPWLRKLCPNDMIYVVCAKVDYDISDTYIP